MPDSSEKPDAGDPPLSLSRLTAAFAKMMRPGGREESPPTEEAVTPEGIVEAMLFVGRSDGAPMTATELAEPIRDVTPEEVEQIVLRLNKWYEQDGSPRRISFSPAGYRMGLTPEYVRYTERLEGRSKPARLSEVALEVLAIIGYQQPLSADQIDQIRGKRSGAAVAQLVRRGLVRREAPSGSETTPVYRTTDDFLKMFRIGSVARLPRLAEVDG